MKHNKKAALAVLAMSALGAGSAWAVPVTLTGTTVQYQFDDSTLGLFGPASVVGDSLVFAPTNFKATSTGILNPGFASQTINVTVSTLSSTNQLTAFSLAENGSYTRSAGTVGVAGMFTALDSEGTTGNNVAGAITVAAPLSASSGNWNAAAGVSLPAAGWGGADGIVNSVKLTIANQLFVAGGVGDIWKSGVTIHATTAPIPEAETYAMMLAGLGLVGLMVRRRNRMAV